MMAVKKTAYIVVLMEQLEVSVITVTPIKSLVLAGQEKQCLVITHVTSIVRTTNRGKEMSNFFKKLKLIFTYGEELEDLLKKAKAEKEAQQRWRDSQRLHLCFNHRQEPNHSDYSEHNCDHCKVLAQLNLKGETE